MFCKKEKCCNMPISKGKYCELHRKGKRCIEPNCNKSAQGGTDKCISHDGGL